jgi:hypothetical protein
MAMWSAYMPAGIMLMLLIGPLLPIVGWRNFWITIGGRCLRRAFGNLRAAADRILAPRADGPFLQRCCTHRPQPQLLDAGGCVLCLLMPDVLALLTSRNGIALGMANMVSALVLAIGKTSSGFLLPADVPI